jgi:hypothetical protein
MKTLVFLASLSVVAGAAAADVPTPLKSTQAFAHVMRLEDLIHGTVTYRVDFCDQGDCDMIQADAAHAAALADYSLLFASTHPDYLAASPKPLDDAAMASVLSKGAKQYGCTQDKGPTQCTMHALFKAGKLKRFILTQKDAASYEEVDEDGQYIPGGYD